MSGSIVRSVRKIKGDLGSIVAANQIVRLCQTSGHARRDRTLGPVETLPVHRTGVAHWGHLIPARRWLAGDGHGGVSRV